MDPATLGNLPALIQQFSNSYVADLTPELITSLVCMVNKVPEEQISFSSIGPEMVSTGPDNTMLPVTEKITQFLADQLSP